MTDRRTTLDDRRLEAALRAVSSEIDWPTASPSASDGTAVGPDLATRVRVRLASRERPRRWWTFGGRPLRRGLVLALLALLGLAIVAGAMGLGLPGLRITLGEPPASVLPSPTTASSPTGNGAPTPSPTLPPIAGMRLALGRQVDLSDVEAATGVPVRLPTDPRLGPPDSVWVDRTKGDQLAYVWASSGELPDTLEPGVGLVLMRFDGRDERDFYDKAIHSGTTLERVKVAGHDGYWISGDPHFFFYTTADGRFVEDSRRWVGDALIWNDGSATYRIESALGRDATIAIAESIE
ncbi:MAG TPA: hypothetical protein VFM38_13380 [Candidatus Limnocylindrales bacterium]|nr:hypothetical protein [Candidatus Limnocylindrales bacterium]